MTAQQVRRGANSSVEEVLISVNEQWVRVPAGLSVVGALMTLGYKVLRHNLVTGEPRTAFCGMGICAECAIEIDGIAQSRSCLRRVQPGMQILMKEL